MKRQAVLSFVFACVLAACGSSSSSSSATTSPARHAAAASSLDKIALQQSDVTAPYKVRLYHLGNDVAGEVSLDVCAADFPSEQYRVKRHQVGASDASGKPVGLSTETIVYDTIAHAQQAMAELRKAEANCPTDFRQSPVAGAPMAKTTFAAPPDADWPAHPAVDRIAMDFTITTQDGQSFQSNAIFQLDGRTLVALYAKVPDGTTALTPASGGIKGFSAVLADRLHANASS